MRKLILSFSLLTLLTFSLPLLSTFAAAQQYDLVLEGGRVMDPETNLDAVRNVGYATARSSPSPPRRSTGIASSRPAALLSLPASSICISTARI
ncbi:MAG: hypothetical protein WBW53_02560 [Terriglobales bacterium]